MAPLICLVVPLAALASPTSARTEVEEVHLVGVEGDAERPFAFEPAHLTIRKGVTVRWANTADVFHTVTFAESPDQRVPNGTFDQSLSAEADTVERAFDTPGTFPYFCQPHSTFMAGTITVLDTSENGSATTVRWATSLGAALALMLAGLFVTSSRRRRRRPST